MRNWLAGIAVWMMYAFAKREPCHPCGDPDCTEDHGDC